MTHSDEELCYSCLQVIRKFRLLDNLKVALRFLTERRYYLALLDNRFPFELKLIKCLAYTGNSKYLRWMTRVLRGLDEQAYVGQRKYLRKFMFGQTLDTSG